MGVAGLGEEIRPAAVEIDEHRFLSVLLEVVGGRFVEVERALDVAGLGVDVGDDREGARGVDVTEALELADELARKLACLVEATERRQGACALEVQVREERLILLLSDERKRLVEKVEGRSADVRARARCRRATDARVRRRRRARSP